MKKLQFNHYVHNSQFYHISRSYIAPGKPFPIHGHDFIEIFWIDQGSGMHLINDLKTPLEKGDIVFIRPQDKHGFSSSKNEGLYVSNLALKMKTVQVIVDRYRLNKLYWNHEFNLPNKINLTFQQLKWFSQQLGPLSHGDDRSQFQLDRFLLNMFHQLENTEDIRFNSPTPNWLLEALKEMSYLKNFSQGTQRFFDLAGRSQEHVTRILKHYTGQTPNQWITQYRLENAAQRLIISEDDIHLISIDLGFESLSHFYKIFKKRYGLPPKQYRVQHRKIFKAN